MDVIRKIAYFGYFAFFLKMAIRFLFFSISAIKCVSALNLQQLFIVIIFILILTKLEYLCRILIILDKKNLNYFFERIKIKKYKKAKVTKFLHKHVYDIYNMYI